MTPVPLSANAGTRIHFSRISENLADGEVHRGAFVKCGLNDLGVQLVSKFEAQRADGTVVADAGADAVTEVVDRLHVHRRPDAAGRRRPELSSVDERLAEKFPVQRVARLQIPDQVNV